MSYCAKSDPQASRLMYILTTFNHVIVARAPASTSLMRETTPPGAVPGTPGAMSNSSSNDPLANFFISHPANSNTTPSNSNQGPPTTYTPTATCAPSQPPSLLARRDSLNALAGPSPSPGTMPPSSHTPPTSAAGDLMSDAEWFHFDTLWENWGPTATAVAAPAALTDPALFNGGTAPMNAFDAGGGAPPSAFATPPMPSTQVDGRFNGPSSSSGGGMQVPLYQMMRFTE